MSPPVEPSDREAALAELWRVINSFARQQTVTVITPHGGPLNFVIPAARFPQRLYTEWVSDECEQTTTANDGQVTAKITGEDGHCASKIKEVLRSAGHRLTTSGIIEAMSEAGAEYSERKISGELARMVRSEILTNDKDSRPAGYGLPEWDERN